MMENIIYLQGKVLYFATIHHYFFVILRAKLMIGFLFGRFWSYGWSFGIR